MVTFEGNVSVFVVTVEEGIIGNEQASEMQTEVTTRRPVEIYVFMRTANEV